MPQSAKRSPSGTRVIKTLHPGQPGTQGWLRMHGGQLLCVRYRVDALERTRYTTIELLVASAPLHHREHPATQVYAALDGKNRALRESAQRLGAQWDEANRMWRMSLAAAQALGIKHEVHTRRRRKAGTAPDR
jgi:hypothetical protein